MEQPKLVYVEWHDVNTDGNGPWCKPEENAPALCFTFGWLLADTDSHVTVSSTYADDGADRESLTCSAIPRGCIKKLELFTLETLLAQQT